MLYEIDGHLYQDESQKEKLGTIRCVNAHDGIREYEGLSKDAGNLPTYPDLRTGSSFLAIDTGDFYKYEETTKTWYKF